MSREFVDRLCSKLENSVYSKYNLVNKNELGKIREELLSDIQYLPYFIRIYLRDEYYNIIIQNNELYVKVKEDNEKTLKEKTIEFIHWINKHENYHKILNEKEYKQLSDELKEVGEEITYLKKHMK